MPRKRNPNGFTTDEAQTASLIMSEGTFACLFRRYNQKALYGYPRTIVRMCDKEALEPASRVFGRPIYPAKTKGYTCPPRLFPPDGRGIWRLEQTGTPAEKVIERLKPLLSQEALRKWNATKQRCLAARRRNHHQLPPPRNRRRGQSNNSNLKPFFRSS